MTMPVRHGLSLLELVISLSLFGVVMVAVLQSMISTTNYVEFDTARSEQETASIRFQNQVLNDFANAAWFFQFDANADRLYQDPVTKARVPLYPDVADDGSTIEFLRLRSSMTVADSPAKERYAHTNFRSDTTKPVDFSRYVDAVPTPLMIVNPKYIADPQWYVAPVWESHKVGLDFDANQDPRNLRHYVYVVESNSRGTKSLVRKYLNGYTGSKPAYSAWNLDEVLIDEVESVKFATHLQDDKLNENQVSLSVLLTRDLQGSAANTGAKVKRRIDFTAAMRSINQEN
jgi:prepilin-type N-terminal cleavage/methylation domain-containing protein